VVSYTHPKRDVCMASLPNGGRLNWVFELVGVPYGPRPLPGTDAFIEASKKRKMDAAGKMHVKRVKALGKRKADSVDIVVSRAKSGSKRPSDANMAPAKPAKWIKKVAPNPAAAPVMTRVIVGASGSKGAASGAKRAAVTSPKRRVPALRMLAKASSVESQESSPHEPLP
jgi:hypothetical protein